MREGGLREDERGAEDGGDCGGEKLPGMGHGSAPTIRFLCVGVKRSPTGSGGGCMRRREEGSGLDAEDEAAGGCLGSDLQVQAGGVE